MPAAIFPLALGLVFVVIAFALVAKASLSVSNLQAHKDLGRALILIIAAMLLIGLACATLNL
jgi:hypothetical protein